MLVFIILLVRLHAVFCAIDNHNINQNDYPEFIPAVSWPNGIIPFYVQEADFDPSETLEILKTISMFTYSTCLRFVQKKNQAVFEQILVLLKNKQDDNCFVSKYQQNNSYEFVFINIAKECTKSPHLESLIMMSLGFSYEHKRVIRDSYIQILKDNINEDYLTFFDINHTSNLPQEIQELPYDVNSVLHINNTDYAIIGKKSFIFKNSNVTQNRIGLSQLDIKKINILYGRHCKLRDLKEERHICTLHKSVIIRNKRDIDINTNLRINREITPPSNVITSNKQKINENNGINIKFLEAAELGIENGTREAVDKIYDMLNTALKTTRKTYCNESKYLDSTIKTPDMANLIEKISKYSLSMVKHAIEDTKDFCHISKNVDEYLLKTKDKLFCNKKEA